MFKGVIQDEEELRRSSGEVEAEVENDDDEEDFEVNGDES